MVWNVPSLVTERIESVKAGIIVACAFAICLLLAQRSRRIDGLALVEEKLILPEFWSLAILVMQSLISFAIARWILDLARARKLIQPFLSGFYRVFTGFL